jgi:VWFA-related protein
MTLGGVRHRASVAALVLAVLPPPPGPGQEPRPPEFSARVEMVTVEVTVLDGKGQPVPGLGRDAFALFEDGVKQEISAFEAIDLREGLPSPDRSAAEPTPPGPTAADPPPARSWTYLLVVDDLHLTPSQATDVRKAASTLLGSVPAGARFVLIATGARMVEDHRMPAGREVLEARLAKIRGSLSVTRGDELISDQEAYEIHVRHDAVIEDIVTRRIVRLERGDDFEMDDPHAEQAGMLRAITETRGRAAKRYYLTTLRTRTTLGVLANALRWLAGTKGRRLVVLASRGFIRDPGITEFEDVVRASLLANVAVTFLDVRGQGGVSPYESAEYGPALEVGHLPQAVADGFSEAAGTESLALETGGLIIHRANNLGKGIERILAASRTCYLIGFLPANGARDGKYRRLSVRLVAGGDGRSVVGRRGYYAPRD